MSVGSVGGPSGPEQVSGDSSYSQLWQNIASLALGPIYDDPPRANDYNDTALYRLNGLLTALLPFIQDKNMPASLQQDYYTLRSDLNDYMADGKCTYDKIFPDSATGSNGPDLEALINDFKSCNVTLYTPQLDMANSVIALGNQIINKPGDPDYDPTLDINNPKCALGASNFYIGFTGLFQQLVNTTGSPFAKYAFDANYATLMALGSETIAPTPEHLGALLNGYCGLSKLLDDLGLSGLIPPEWSNYPAS